MKCEPFFIQRNRPSLLGNEKGTQRPNKPTRTQSIHKHKRKRPTQTEAHRRALPSCDPEEHCFSHALAIHTRERWIERQDVVTIHRRQHDHVEEMLEHSDRATPLPVQMVERCLREHEISPVLAMLHAPHEIQSHQYATCRSGQ